MVTELTALRYLLLDMDGVLYRGRQVIPDAPAFVQGLEQAGIRYLMVTNNSSRPARKVAEQLAQMGLLVRSKDILTSAEATAIYMTAHAPAGSRVYVIGGPGLQEAMHDAGFVVTEASPDYVIVGIDRQLTYDKLRIGCMAIRRGAKFIASNPDRTFPAEEGIVPGAGAIVAALEACTDVAPQVIGKPARPILDIALARLGAEPARTAVVGDRLDTDILGGINAGLTTILVLTGVSTREELARSPYQPDYVFDDLTTLVRQMTSA